MELLGAHITLLLLKVGHYSEIVERLKREGRKPFLIDNHASRATADYVHTAFRLR